MALRSRRIFVALFVAGLGALALALWSQQAVGPDPDDPRAEAPTTTEALFVGSAACASCHAEQSKAWQTSQHQQAMQPATERTVRGDFGNATLRHHGLESTFFKKGDGYFVRTDGPDGAPGVFEIRYTFGVAPLQQYLVEFPDGRLQALPTAWDSRPAERGGQRWFHLYANESIDAGDELHWTKRLQNWNVMCADCHSTNLRTGYNDATNRFTTTWSEISVGCEACHGPASRHVEWAHASTLVRRLFWQTNGLTNTLDERRGVEWRIDPVSSKPVRSTPRTTSRELDTCAVCHSRRGQIAEGYFAGARFADFYAASPLAPGLYHSDGQQLDEVYTYGSFLESRMHAAGVTCADCHSPHSARLRADGNALCATCHVPARYDTPSHHFHQAAPAPPCVSCHMPARTYMTVDPRRDHSLRVPRPDRTVTIGTPNACNDCHTRETPAWAAAAVRRWLGRDAGGFQTFAETFASADRSETPERSRLPAIAVDSSAPAVVRASALERLILAPSVESIAAAERAFGDHDEMTRRMALRNLAGLPPRDRLIALPLLRDPVRAVRIEAARVLAPALSLFAGPNDRGSFNRAAAELVTAERLRADWPEARTNLGTFFIESGKSTEGIGEFRTSIRLDPRYTPAYVNLADALGRQGQEADAEAVLRQGLGLMPDSADLHHALGLSLARAAKYADSVSALGRAADLAPNVARFGYAFAVALHSTGRSSQAIEVLEGFRQRHPRDRDVLTALATFYRDAGRLSQARARAAELANLFPADQEIAALVASLGTSPQ